MHSPAGHERREQHNKGTARQLEERATWCFCLHKKKIGGFTIIPSGQVHLCRAKVQARTCNFYNNVEGEKLFSFRFCSDVTDTLNVSVCIIQISVLGVDTTRGWVQPAFLVNAPPPRRKEQESSLVSLLQFGRLSRRKFLFVLSLAGPVRRSAC